jgi:hypothetical protein
MKDKKNFKKNNNNNSYNSFIEENKENHNSANEQAPKETTMAQYQDLTNKTKISNEIIDIDDSPDVATWNKEVTRNKAISEEINNNYKLTDINPNIPPIATIGLERKQEVEDKEKFRLMIDPANQQEIDDVYKDGDKLTDNANFFYDKRKLNKNKD